MQNIALSQKILSFMSILIAVCYYPTRSHFPRTLKKKFNLLIRNYKKRLNRSFLKKKSKFVGFSKKLNICILQKFAHIAYLSFLKSRSSTILKHFTCNFVTGILKVHNCVGNFDSNGFNNGFNIKNSDQSIRK